MPVLPSLATTLGYPRHMAVTSGYIRHTARSQHARWAAGAEASPLTAPIPLQATPPMPLQVTPPAPLDVALPEPLRARRPEPLRRKARRGGKSGRNRNRR
jgi:hypothetical protein